MLCACVIVCLILVVYWFSDRIQCPCLCTATLSQVGKRVVGTMATAENATSKPSTHQQINLTRKVTLHYTNWCGACKLMKPVWARVKNALAGSNIKFEELDEDMAKTPGIAGYPTIILIDEFGHAHQYPFDANFERLRDWIISPNLGVA